ncbi:hypothetical protein BH10PSE12_BH10PSE12_08050 [soil metagenome]
MRLFQKLSGFLRRNRTPILEQPPVPSERIPSYLFLTQSLQYNLGADGSFARHKRNQQTIYNSFNSFVERSYENVLIHIYLIKSTIPQLFTLVDFDTPVIAIHIGYIARLDVLMTRRPYLDVATSGTLDIYTRLLLEMVSDYAILLGESGTALKIHSAAQADGVSHAYQEHFLDMQNSDVDENYLIKWYFCVAHEVGHIFTAKRVPLWTRRLEITEADVSETLSEIMQDPSILMICADYNFRVYPDAIDVSDLVEEIQADLIGIETLLRFAQETLQWDPGNIQRVHWFCRELLWTFHFIFCLTCCRIIARAVVEGEEIGTARNRYKQFTISFLVRLKYIELFLGHAAGRNIFAWTTDGELPERPDPAVAGIAAAVSKAFWSTISPRIDQCCVEAFEANAAKDHPKDRDDGILKNFRAKCENFGRGIRVE